MSTTFFTTPSHSRHLYNRKRKLLSDKDDGKDIAANSRPSFRWVVLAIICFSMFSYSYCYDNPVALQSQLQMKYNLSNVEYNLLYSAYTFPNMVLPFFSGISADIFSADLIIIIFFLFIVIGQSCFVIGCVINIYYVMFIGRFLFGIGAESLTLVITPLIYEYFKNKELSFALGLLLSLSRLGSSTNDYLTFLIYSKTNNNIIVALSTGLIILVTALILIIILLLQRYFVYYMAKKNRQLLLSAGSNDKLGKKRICTYCDSLAQHPVNSMTHSIDITITQQNTTKYRDNEAVSYDETRRHYSLSSTNNHPLPALDLADNDDNSASDNHGSDEFRLRDVCEFDAVFWLLVINCGLIYGVVLSFMNIGSDFLQIHYGYGHRLGNTLLMIPYIVGAILTPIFGYISDRIGRRGYLLFISTIMLIVTNYIFTWLNTRYIYIETITAMSCLGISYSIFCAVIWPSFALVIPEKLLGTGYGIPCVFIIVYYLYFIY